MRFAAMGELTASIAHEINQPLGAILANAEAAELLLQNGKAGTGQLREILADIRRDDLRAHEVIRRLRALLEKHEVRHEPMRLHSALADVLALLAPEAERRGVTLEQHFDALDDRLLGDAVQLQQVLMNLVLNAMDAMEQTAPGDRRVRITTAERGDALALSVADRGCGIDAAMHTTIFDSFVTTKARAWASGCRSCAPSSRLITDTSPWPRSPGAAPASPSRCRGALASRRPNQPARCRPPSKARHEGSARGDRAHR